MTKVHLVVPCHQESDRIDSYLPDLCQQMAVERGVKILVVEDGSGDVEQRRMEEKIEALRQRYECLAPLFKLPENVGKGGAVYAGWRIHESADWLGFVDADGACPAHEVARLIHLSRSQGDPATALFASRVKMLGKNVDRLWKRHLTGRIYATLVSELLSIAVYDSQCGLKLVPTTAFERVRERLVVSGFAFDVELLVALLDSGCRVEEVPIDWKEVPGGKVKVFRDSWRMACDVWRIRARRTGPI